MQSEINMKYVVVLGDGMADFPCPSLGGKTPLMCADKPNIDSLVPNAEIGLARTVPTGMKPASDTANLAVMGYDPKVYYSGRSPLEAESMGIDFKPEDVTYRCNLVTLGDEEPFSEKTMADYSAGEITTAEAKQLIGSLAEVFNTEEISLYPGISYRHCLLIRDGADGAELTPPHDISGKVIGDYLPKGTNGDFLLDLMLEAQEILKDHPVNVDRKRRGLKPANSVWFWGEGRKPKLPDFYGKYHRKGAVISAVDLIKGIGKIAGMQVIDVPGATGNIDTNYAGKAQAAIDALRRDRDFVYIHIEAPDECGHRGECENKIKAIQDIDSLIVAPVLDALRQSGEEFSMLILPDHPTPISTKTHDGSPVPYLMYRSDNSLKSDFSTYDEQTAKQSGIFNAEGYTLLDKFLK